MLAGMVVHGGVPGEVRDVWVTLRTGGMRCCVLCVCSLAVLVVCCGVRLLPLSKICVSHTHTRRTGTLQGATSACRVTAFPHEFTSVHIGQCQPHKHVTKSRAQDDALSIHLLSGDLGRCAWLLFPSLPCPRRPRSVT